MKNKDKEVGFRERDDGFWQWDTDSLTFLIGDTNENVKHIALWVSTVSCLYYRMVERREVSGNPLEQLNELKDEAKVLMVRSRVMGGKKFIGYLKERQERFDTLMQWASHGSSVPEFLTEVK